MTTKAKAVTRGPGDEIICPSITYWASAVPALSLLRETLLPMAQIAAVQDRIRSVVQQAVGDKTETKTTTRKSDEKRTHDGEVASPSISTT